MLASASGAQILPAAVLLYVKSNNAMRTSANFNARKTYRYAIFPKLLDAFHFLSLPDRISAAFAVHHLELEEIHVRTALYCHVDSLHKSVNIEDQQNCKS